MGPDVFQEISEENISSMLEALKQDWPKHFTLFQITTVTREYLKAGCQWRQTIYLHGDYSTGVYIHRLQVPSGSADYFYIYTPNSILTPLKESLEKTEVIPWEKSFILMMIDSKFSSVIYNVLASKNATYHINATTLFWYPPHKEIIPKEIPEGLCLKFLDSSHVEEVNRNWPHKSPGSEKVLAEHITRNFGLGLFMKSDNKLLCSALSMNSGGIFVLYTDPEFRGKGYAGFVVEGMTLEIRKRNRIPFGTIIIGNKPSETTFTRAGFEPWSQANFVMVNSTN